MLYVAKQQLVSDSGLQNFRLRSNFLAAQVRVVNSVLAPVATQLPKTL